MRQYGVATSAQLLDLGVSPSDRSCPGAGSVRPSASRAVPARRLRLELRARAMAAQLHCGPRFVPRRRDCWCSSSVCARCHVAASTQRDRQGHGAGGAAMDERRSDEARRHERAVHPSALRCRPSAARCFSCWPAQFNFHRFERAAEDAWHLGLCRPSQAAEYLAARPTARRGRSRHSSSRWLRTALPRTAPVRAASSWTPSRRSGWPASRSRSASTRCSC